jgi:hypothetical protein
MNFRKEVEFIILKKAEDITGYKGKWYVDPDAKIYMKGRGGVDRIVHLIKEEVGGEASRYEVYINGRPDPTWISEKDVYFCRYIEEPKEVVKPTDTIPLTSFSARESLKYGDLWRIGADCSFKGHDGFNSYKFWAEVGFGGCTKIASCSHQYNCYNVWFGEDVVYVDENNVTLLLAKGNAVNQAAFIKYEAKTEEIKKTVRKSKEFVYNKNYEEAIDKYFRDPSKYDIVSVKLTLPKPYVVGTAGIVKIHFGKGEYKYHLFVDKKVGGEVTENYYSIHPKRVVNIKYNVEDETLAVPCKVDAPSGYTNECPMVRRPVDQRLACSKCCFRSKRGSCSTGTIKCCFNSFDDLR